MERVSDQPDYGADIRRSGERTVVALTGEVDLATADDMAATLRAELAVAPVVLDLRELTFMDSSGVRVLDALLRDIDREGWQLRIDRRLTPVVENVLSITGMISILPFENPEPEETS